MAQINKPSDYFNTKLYTGNGGTNNITGVNFQPDFVWLKHRDGTFGHDLYDAIRGVGKVLNTNNTNAEYTETDRLTAFNADGFSLGSEPPTNGNGNLYVSWNWLGANGTTSNTDGSITSTVSANTTSGFSIVSYTGSGTSSDTVGHGLGAVPALIIGKNRDSGARSWPVKHKDLSSNNGLFLNLTNAQASPGDGTFANLDNSSTFGFYSGSNADNVNQSGQNFIAYCFAEKKGFSKFGSYTGNGSTEGTFVYTGFKPAFVLTKWSTGSASWYVYDNRRSDNDEGNPQDRYLRPNFANAQGSDHPGYDFVSNGFKNRNADPDLNVSGRNYIYMAFAEQPLVGTNNIPATAR